MDESKKPRVFDEQYLLTLLKRDAATILATPDKLNSNASIHFKCSCSQEVTKLFCSIVYYGGAFCKKCIVKNKSQKIKNTCKQLYGVTNVSQVEKFQKKKEETYLENWGMHPKKTKEVQEKYEATCLERYNTINSAQVSSVKEKIKETFQEKYGGHPMHNDTVKEKVRETCFERYGGYPAENEEVKKKIEKVFMDKYGCYPTQTTEVMEKQQHSSKKYKRYTMPSGAVRLVQGYEPFALRDLLQLYTEEQIISERKDIPRFSYTMQEKSKYYFPDMYIPHINTILEIKSSYTYKKDKEKLDCVKGNILEHGYAYEIWIYSRKGECIQKIL